MFDCKRGRDFISSLNAHTYILFDFVHYFGSIVLIQSLLFCYCYLTGGGGVPAPGVVIPPAGGLLVVVVVGLEVGLPGVGLAVGRLVGGPSGGKLGYLES